MYDIIIPSCKPYSFLMILINSIREHDTEKCNYIATGFNASAAANRNMGIHEAMKTDNPYIIMIDDDIGGFYPGWQKDLCAPFEDLDVRLSSARLINLDGTLSEMMGTPADLSKKLLYLKPINAYGKRFKTIPSAAIAFRKKDIADIRFNYDFIGSGFEDTHFCWQLNQKYPNCEMVVNNECKLIHYHEMKNQNQNNNYNENVFKKLIG